MQADPQSISSHGQACTIRSNSVGEYLVLNNFPRIAQINEAKLKLSKEQLLLEHFTPPQDSELNPFGRKFRCHSSARISLSTVFSMESCITFIRKRRRLLATNVRLLLSDCVQLLKDCEDKSKHCYIHELITIILCYEATPVIKLKESMCSAMFKRTIVLEKLIDHNQGISENSPAKLSPSSSFSGSPGPDGSVYKYDEDDPQKSNFNKQIKTIIGKFRYLLAYIGFYIQCFHSSESVGSSEYNKSHSVADFFIQKTDYKRISSQIMSKRLLSSGNLISLMSMRDVNLLLERKINCEENEEPGMIAAKERTLDQFFRNKVDKWCQAKMAKLAVTCRICSKEINAKKFDRHAEVCNLRLLTESKIDQISDKIGDLANSINKYQRTVNVELLIEKSALAKQKIQTASTIANLAKLHRMGERVSKMNDAKRNTLSILPENIEEVPEEEYNGKGPNLLSENLLESKILRPRNSKPIEAQVGSHFLMKIPSFVEEVPDNEESTPMNRNLMAHSSSNFGGSMADALDRLEEMKTTRPMSFSINKPPRKFDDSQLDSLTDKSLTSEKNSIADLDNASAVKDPIADFLKLEKNKFGGSEQTPKQAPTKKPNPKKLFRQTSWDPWNENANEEAESFKLGNADTTPSSTIEDLDKVSNGPTSLNELDTSNMSISGTKKKNPFDLDQSSKKFDEFLKSRKHKKGHSSTLINGEKRKLATETKQRMQKIKRLNGLLKGYSTLKNNLSMVQQFDSYSKEMQIYLDDAKKAIKHNYTHITDEKFRSISWALLENINKKLEHLRQISQYQKELDSLEQASRHHETLRRKSNTSDLAFHNNLQQDGPDTPSKNKPKANKARAKSAQRAINSYRQEIFSRNIKKMAEILRKEKKLGNIEAKRNTLLEHPNLRKMLIIKALSAPKQHDPKSRISHQLSGDLIDKAGPRRVRTTTMDLTPGRYPVSKISKFNKEKLYKDDDNLRPDENKDDLMKKARTNLPLTPSSNNSSESSSGSSSSSDSNDSSSSSSSDNESFEDPKEFFDDQPLGDDIDKHQEIHDTAYFSDDASTIKVFKEKPSQLANLIGINDFEFIKFISKGAYGKVYLVRRKATGDLFAMKLIPFSDRMCRNSIDSLKNEKKVFEVLKGDWVVKAPFTFVHENYLCIVMELMVGGDFAHILQEYTYMDQISARFYIAEVILALDSLHQLKIIHRDLKPDNLLLSKDGHLKLTDFGLSEVGIKQKKNIRPAMNLNPDAGKSNAKSRKEYYRRGSTLNLSSDIQNKLAKLLKGESSENVEIERVNGEVAKTKTGNRVVGTPDYIAPEVLNGENYDDPCIDWWSVGVLLFEFLTGIPPFNADTVDEIFENIKHRRIPWDDITIGYEEDQVTPEAKDLIDKLLTLDRKKRLGAKGLHEIQSHEFFNGFDWTTVEKQKPPLVPENKISLEKNKEVINPFDAVGTSLTKINTRELTFNRIDILHAENKKILEETKMKAKYEPTVQEDVRRRKWSCFDDDIKKK